MLYTCQVITFITDILKLLEFTFCTNQSTSIWGSQDYDTESSCCSVVWNCLSIHCKVVGPMGHMLLFIPPNFWRPCMEWALWAATDKSTCNSINSWFILMLYTCQVYNIYCQPNYRFIKAARIYLFVQINPRQFEVRLVLV